MIEIENIRYFRFSLHRLRDCLAGDGNSLVDRGRPQPREMRQDDPRVLHGGRHQLLDPHPHTPPLHALPLLHKGLPFPRTLHILEHYEGNSRFVDVFVAAAVDVVDI